MWHRLNYILVLILIGTAPVANQERPSVTDAEAYVLYGLLVPQVWNNRTRGPIQLQLETEIDHYSCADPKVPSRAWQSAVDSFHLQNERVHLLQPLLPRDVGYCFITRAKLEEDNARLALKYPGGWHIRPETLLYAAVSAVGFNRDKTKAVLYVRREASGNIFLMEKRDGKWMRAFTPCGWIA